MNDVQPVTNPEVVTPVVPAPEVVEETAAPAPEAVPATDASATA